jgi:hypothetical protein
MARATIVPVLVALVVITTAMANAQPPTQSADLPSDVAALIARRAGCQDAMSKLQAGNEDSDQLAATFQSLRCSDIGADQQALRTKYGAVPQVLAALDATWVKVVRRVPVTAAPAPDPSAAPKPHAN